MREGMRESMKKDGWKVAGKILALVLEFFRILKSTLKPKGVNALHFFSWVTGSGKKVFTEKFLEPLADEFLAVCRIFTVDCDKYPFEPDSLHVETTSRIGVIEISRDNLGVHVLESSVSDSFGLSREIANIEEIEIMLNANVLDLFLKEESAMELLRKGSWLDNGLVIAFWGTKYRNKHGDIMVRGLKKENGEIKECFVFPGKDSDFIHEFGVAVAILK